MCREEDEGVAAAMRSARHMLDHIICQTFFMLTLFATRMMREPAPDSFRAAPYVACYLSRRYARILCFLPLTLHAHAMFVAAASALRAGAFTMLSPCTHSWRAASVRAGGGPPARAYARRLIQAQCCRRV